MDAFAGGIADEPMVKAAAEAGGAGAEQKNDNAPVAFAAALEAAFAGGAGTLGGGVLFDEVAGLLFGAGFIDGGGERDADGAFASVAGPPKPRASSPAWSQANNGVVVRTAGSVTATWRLDRLPGSVMNDSVDIAADVIKVSEQLRIHSSYFGLGEVESNRNSSISQP